MDISKSSFTFFRVIEREIKTDLKNHFKNILNAAGWNSAILIDSFEIDDIDGRISSLQDFVRESMQKMLEIDDVDIQQKWAAFFYGAYSNDRASFEFNDGEKILIRIIVRLVKDKVKAEGLAYFQPVFKGKSAWPKTLTDSPYGLIYGDGDYKKVKPKMTEQFGVADLQKQLLHKTITCIKKHQPSLNCNETEKNMSLDSIIVSIDGDKIKGIVKCCFCNGPKNEIKVFCQESENNFYWIPSNFEKHLINHHTHTSKSERKQMKMDHVKITDTSSLVDSIADNASLCDNDNTSIIALDIAIIENKSSDAQNLEDNLATQITKQNLLMMQATAKNSDRVRDFLSVFDPITEEYTPMIKVCDVKADNSCLFGSIAHQLGYFKLNSKEHETFTRTLRKDVVKYIANNLSDFLFLLKNRVTDRKTTDEDSDDSDDDDDDDDDETKCRGFVANELSSLKVWGGSETIKAVSEIHKVNIVILNDDGKCNFAHSYHPSNEKTITIAFCNLNGKVQTSNANRNHYNSVVEINGNRINEAAAKLAEAECKRMQFVKNIADCKTIELT